METKNCNIWTWDEAESKHYHFKTKNLGKVKDQLFFYEVSSNKLSRYHCKDLNLSKQCTIFKQNLRNESEKSTALCSVLYYVGSTFQSLFLNQQTQDIIQKKITLLQDVNYVY